MFVSRENTGSNFEHSYYYFETLYVHVPVTCTVSTKINIMTQKELEDWPLHTQLHYHYRFLYVSQQNNDNRKNDDCIDIMTIHVTYYLAIDR